MKNAFTMIELIFVIVILGILAAIAVPKIGGVREKAELVKASTNFVTAINDMVINASLNNGVLKKDETNAATEAVEVTNALDRSSTNKNSIMVGSEKCLKFNLGSTGKKAEVEITAATNTAAGFNGKCDAFFKENAVADVFETKPLADSKVQNCPIDLLTGRIKACVTTGTTVNS